MLTFFGADDFLRHVIEHRVLYAGGRLGSHKSAVCVALSWLFHREGLVKYTVGTCPVSWGVDARLAPATDVCAILDEAGVWFDARNYGSGKQNVFRKTLLAYLRRLNAILLVPSRLSPDVSFRVLTVQRTFSFEFIGVPLDIYTYALGDGELGAEGRFGVYDLAWLWRVDNYNPSQKYADDYIPGGLDAIQGLFERGMAAHGEADADPHQFPTTDPDTFRAYCKRLGLVPRESDRVHGAFAGSRGDLSLANSAEGSGEQGGQLVGQGVNVPADRGLGSLARV